MTDRFGRNINYLRVSVTQRCNLNCIYCGSECPDFDELTADEIAKITRAFALCGIEKVRLTGGEPLARADIVEIAQKISEINGIKKLALTTNGVKLKKYAYDLKCAGVSAVNVSIDSLDRENYRRITGRDCLPQVLEGLDEAEKVGLKLRVNAVLVRGENDGEAEKLINLAKNRRLDVRFIELMPFSDAGRNERFIIKGDEILKRFSFLKPVDNGRSAFEQSVAKYYEADGFTGRIGLITPVSEKFCDECNRIRLLSDGKIKPCLGHEETYDLKPCLGEREKMLETVRTAIFSKPKGHEFNCGYGNTHAMNKIGG